MFPFHSPNVLSLFLTLDCSWFVSFLFHPNLGNKPKIRVMTNWVWFVYNHWEPKTFVIKKKKVSLFLFMLVFPCHHVCFPFLHQQQPHLFYFSMCSWEKCIFKEFIPWSFLQFTNSLFFPWAKFLDFASNWIGSRY
jgi:hypothetical protein